MAGKKILLVERRGGRWGKNVFRDSESSHSLQESSESIQGVKNPETGIVQEPATLGVSGISPIDPPHYLWDKDCVVAMHSLENNAAIRRITPSVCEWGL